MATSLTDRISKDVLDREADARFWLQTHYRIGKKLDPNNASDKAMVKVWLDIYNKVKRENTAGRLVLTYNKPEVKAQIDAAEHAQDTASEHVAAAATAPDPATAAVHSSHADQALDAATSSAQTGAAMQPPTVSPELAHAAAHEVAAQTGAPTPAPLPRDPRHPANAAEAKPSKPLEFFLAMDAAPGAAAGAAGDAGATEVMPPGAEAANGESPARDPRDAAADALAVTQAINAPARAVQTHQVSKHLHAPRPQSSISPATVAQIRDTAKAHAASGTTPFVGVAQSAEGSWVVESLPSRDALDGWYGTVTNDQAEGHPQFIYAAMFDANDPTAATHDPVYELFGSGQAIPVSVTVNQAPAPAPDLAQAPPASDPLPSQPPHVLPYSSNSGALAALGAASALGLVAALASNKAKAGRRGGRL